MSTQMNFGPEWMRGGGGGGGNRTSSSNVPTAKKDDSRSFSRQSKDHMPSFYKWDGKALVETKHHKYAAINDSQNSHSPINKQTLSSAKGTILTDVNNKHGSGDEDVPFWIEDDKDNMGTFDSNGVFHLGSAMLPHGNAEFEEKNDIFSSSTIFQGGEHRRAVSHPNSFLNRSSFAPPPSTPTSTSTSTHQLHHWLYKDPTGKVQGPFTAFEMQEWFDAGYFNHSLKIKRDDVPFFEPLSVLIKQANDPKAPFLATCPTIQQENSRLLPSLTPPLLNNTLFGPFGNDPNQLPASDRFPLKNQELQSKSAFATAYNNLVVHSSGSNDQSMDSLTANNGYLHSANVSQTLFGNNAPSILPLARGMPMTSYNIIQSNASPREEESSRGPWLTSPSDTSVRLRQQSAGSLASPGYPMNEFQQQRHHQLAVNQHMEQQYLHMLRQNQQYQLKLQQRILQQQQQQQQQSDMFMDSRLSFDGNKNFPLQQPMLNKDWTSLPGTPHIADSGHIYWGLPYQQQTQETKAAAHEPIILSEPHSPSKTQVEPVVTVDDQFTETINQLSNTTLDSTDGITLKDIQSKSTRQSPYVEGSAWETAYAQKTILGKTQLEEKTSIGTSSSPRFNTLSSVSPREFFTTTPSFSTNKGSSLLEKQQSNPWNEPVASISSSPNPANEAIKDEKQTTASASSTHPTIKSEPKGPSEEFLEWCKLSLRDLNAGVNGDEILEMLLSFPTDNSCSEIIQDIIYANSASMDGRRFASDFVTGRKADMEGKKLNLILPKSSAIATPEFKIVKKKWRKKRQQ